MSHNMIRFSRLVAPLIRLVILLPFVGLIAIEEFQILSDLRFQVKEELIVSVAIGAFDVQNWHILDLARQLWCLWDLVGSLIWCVFVYLINDFLNILQNILGLNLFILLNQIECLELCLSYSFMGDGAAVEVVCPGKLLNSHVLFGINVSLFLLGQLLTTLEPIIILPF